jgi:hypothetical protein
MRIARRLSVAAFLSVSGSLHAQIQETRPLSGGAITAQVSTGIVGTAAGFVGGGLVTRWAAERLGQDEESRGKTALVGAYATSVVFTAVGPALIGSRNTDKGSFGAAVGGAAIGLTTAAILRKIGRKGVFGESGPVALVVGAAIIALPSVGATIAFNRTR